MSGKNGADWRVDVDITLKEKRAFIQAVNDAQTAQDESPLYPWMARFIQAWPYAGDPGKVETYDGLKLSEWGACMKHVLDSFQSVVQPAI